MQLGTAKITREIRNGRNVWTVRWMNAGSFLNNEPRAFYDESDALTFCRDRGLRIRY